MSRRSVVAAAAWSVPAVSLASATPAFANTSQATNVTIAGPSAGVPASGAVPMTVTVKDAQGQPQAGQPVSFSGPDGSSFDAADGVTNGAGQYTANFNLNKPWSKPGATIAVTAVSGSGNASQSFTVLGSNVLGWGSGTFGVTGLGSVANTSSPSQLMQVFPSPVVQVAQGGDYFTLFRLADGTVWGVGRNDQGQLADGTTNDVYWPPQRVPGLSNVVDVAAGYQTGYAVLQDGTVRSWGVNANSALGDGTTYSAKSYSTSVVTVQGVSGAVKVAGGSWFGLALLSNGTVAGWGRNGFGQLGDKTNVDRATATTAVGVSGVTDIAATSVAGYALRSDGSIMAWGGNWKGQQGDGSTQSGNRYTPAAVSGITTATSIASAGEAGYALLADKTVVAWGNGENGELGNGASAASAAPVAVQGLTNVVQIGAGYALTDSGAVYAWGPNNAGQLGDGSSSSGSDVPVAVALPAGIPIQAIGGSAGGNARYVITGELTVSVDVVQDQVAAGSAGTVQAKVSSGSAGVGGAEVSLTATGNAVLGSTLGQTNGNGDLVTTVTPDQWTMPGTQVTVRASTDAAVSADSFTVLGANYLATGSNYNSNLGTGSGGGVSTPTQGGPVFPAPVKAMASGWMHSMALLEDGTVWVSGNNGYGQLGDGSAAGDRALFGQVPSLSNVRQISSGWNHCVALLSDGTVWTWGWNAYGALGNGSTSDSNVPVQVLSGADLITAGSLTTYARKTDGSLWAWGQNSYGGQVGDGTTADRLSPVPVQGLSSGSVRQLAGGAEFVLALLNDGTVKAWGFNGSGQLGNGNTTNQSLPVSVTGLSNVKQIACGRFAGYALLDDGTVRAWGKNEAGQLGNNSTTDSSTPVQVTGLSGVVQLAASAQSAYVLRSDGSVQWWGGDDGYRPDSGNTPITKVAQTVSGLDGHPIIALGSGPRQTGHYYVTGTSSISVDVADTQVTAGVASAVVAKVAAGSEGVPGASVTLTATDGAAVGAPTGTTDASGTFQTTVTPDLWTTPGDVVRVTATSGASSAQDTFRVLGANMLACGSDGQGHMGIDNPGSTQLLPVQVNRVFPSLIAQVASSEVHALVLLKDGTVWSAGENGYGQIGRSTATVPQERWGQIPGLSGVTQIAAGWNNGYALLSDGSVMAWGWNIWGQCGDGTTTDRFSPVKVTGLTQKVTFLAASRINGLVILQDRTAMSWGACNEKGQLGNGSQSNSPVPVAISNLTNVVMLAGGNDANSALLSDGSVWSWGGNANGQIGDGTTTDRLTPVKVPGVNGAENIARGGDAGYAQLDDGSVIAWGSNAYGQIGDGTTTDRLSPVIVNGVNNPAQLAGGYYNGYALQNDGVVKAWGRNDTGQLGTNSTTQSSTPVNVQGLDGRVVTFLSTGARAGTPFFVVGSASISLDVAPVVTAGQAGAVTSTVTAGSKSVVGATVVLSATGGAALASSSAQTDSQGRVQTTVTPDVWTRPGASLSVTAASGSSSATDRYIVSGSNLMHAGYGLWGAGGDGTNNNATSPTQTLRSFSSPVVQAYTGFIFGVALLADGSVWSVGRNDYGQLGDPSVPTYDGSNAAAGRSAWGPVSGLPSNVVQITGGRCTMYALTADGDVYAWGWNANGQIGDGTTTDRSAPVKVPGLSGVKRLGAAYRSCFAIMSDGSVKAWGKNDGGSLGDGTTTQRLSPVAIPGWGSVSDIGGDHQQTAALRTDGTVWACSAVSGTLGNGDGATSASPVQVSGLSNVQGLGVGFGFFHVLKADGTVVGWGVNDVGQIGNGGSSTVLSPTAVSGLSGVNKLSGRWGGGYALLGNGQVWGWGKNDAGQLGDGSTSNRLTPVQMTGLASRTVSRLDAGVSAEGCFLIV